jgi:hypothetical protein
MGKQIVVSAFGKNSMTSRAILDDVELTFAVKAAPASITNGQGLAKKGWLCPSQSLASGGGSRFTVMFG